MSEDSAAGRIADAIFNEYIVPARGNVGSRLPSVRELGDRYGASSHTVVHALGLLVGRGVVEKRRKSGCYITDSPGKQGRGDANMLGFITSMAHSEIITRTSQGVQQACAALGWRLMVAVSGLDYERERQCVADLMSAGCKGVVIMPMTRSREQLRNDYLKAEYRDCPIALIDIAHPEQQHIQVIFDNRRLGREMTEVLINQGHRRIAFIDIGGPDYRDIHKSTHDRYLGYLAALSKAGLPANPDDRWMLRRDPRMGNPELIAPALIGWTQSQDRPTALIALDDSMAVEIIIVAAQLGIAIPDDLEVVGFDNLREGTACGSLTWTSDPDFRRAGEMATELLIDRISGVENTSCTYVLPVPVKQCRSQALREQCRTAIEKSCEDLGLNSAEFHSVR
jgi:GntR family transcriptional regulator of arabinose operon